MKLVAWMSGVCATVAVASLACGCSCASANARAATAQQSAAISDATGTTQLMSAQLPAPPPKVGKSHLAVDADDDSTDAPVSTPSDELGAPKEARRSDGSGRAGRGGHFGTTK